MNKLLKLILIVILFVGFSWGIRHFMLSNLSSQPWFEANFIYAAFPLGLILAILIVSRLEKR